jgi:hypothetical protein
MQATAQTQGRPAGNETPEVPSALRLVADLPQLSMLHRGPFEVRCECQTCGAHAYARPGGAGLCGNCHGTELVPLRSLTT